MWVRLLVSSRVFRSTPPVRGETRRSFRPAARPRWRSPPLPPPLRNQTAGPVAPSRALVLQLVNSCRFSRHSITPRRAHAQPRPLLMSSRKRRIRSSTRVFSPGTADLLSSAPDLKLNTGLCPVTPMNQQAVPATQLASRPSCQRVLRP